MCGIRRAGGVSFRPEYNCIFSMKLDCVEYAYIVVFLYINFIYIYLGQKLNWPYK